MANPVVMKFRNAATTAAFLGPSLVLIGLFHYLPIVSMIRSSLLSYNLIRPEAATWVGLQNYGRILHTPDTLDALRVSITFVVGLVLLQIPLSLGLALLVNRRFRGISLVRGAIFAPVVTSVVVVATIWGLMFNPTHGLLDAILTSAHLPRLAFLTSPHQALPSILAMTLWEQAGFGMVLFLSGLQAIPSEVMEAAEIDGAGRLRAFWFVTLPLLRRTMALVSVIMTAFAFNAFAPAFVMTQGGPDNSTLFFVFHIYQQAFQYLDPGYASALSVVLLLIVLGVSMVQMRFLRATWQY